MTATASEEATSSIATNVIATAGPVPDFALLVAFDDSEVQECAAIRTRYARQNAVLRLARTCSLLEATTRDVVAWLDSIGLSPESRRHYVAHLCCFYTWALGEHLIVLDPMSPLRPRDRERRHYGFGDFGELAQGFWVAQKRRNLSARTIVVRRQLLGRLQDWMGERSLLDATTDDIERYLDSRKIVAKSRYCCVSRFSTFYRWAVREGLIDRDPTERIDRPLLPSYVPRPIGDADLVFALKVAPPDVAAMLTLAAFAGMRCKEIAGLQRTDILDRHRPPMLVVAAPKGRRERSVPLHPKVWRALEAYGLPRTGPVFRYPDGRPVRYPDGHQPGRQMSSWSVSNTVNAYLHGLGIADGAHSLRHWFGSTLYANTRDIRLVQTMLGHADPKTTAVYTQFSPGSEVDAVTALDPEGER